MHATRRLLDYVYKKGSYYDVRSMDDCRVYVKSVTGGLRDRPRRPGDLPPLLSGDLRAGGLSRSLRGGERLGRLRGGLRVRARGGERPLQDSYVKRWMKGGRDSAICL